jgi:hypothetical protein
MAKDPFKLFDPEQSEKLRRALALPPGLEEVPRKEAWTPEQLEKLRNCGLPPEQMEALREHNAALYRHLQPPEQQSVGTLNVSQAAQTVSAAASVMPLGTPSAPHDTPLEAPQPAPPDDLRPSPQEVRAKLAARTLELAVYEILLRRHPPDGDPRDIPRKDVHEVLKDELNRARFVSKSTLARVLRALRGR